VLHKIVKMGRVSQTQLVDIIAKELYSHSVPQLQLAVTTIDDESPILHNIFRSSSTTTPHMIQSLRHSRINIFKEYSLMFFFIVAPCILKSKVSHLPTDALFITLGKV
jgi:hypothetical protein